MDFLIDTDVLSESRQARPNPKVVAWLRRHDAAISLSPITLGEVRRGIKLLGPGRKRAALETWFVETEAWAIPRLVLPDAKVMRVWASVTAHYRQAGRTLPVLDSLIAATALTHGMTLVTRNCKDYPQELEVLDLWEA